MKIAMLIAISGGTLRNTPLTTLVALCVFALFPWAGQQRRNRDSAVGVSRIDAADERLWRRVACVLIPVFIVAFLAGKKLGWFTSWSHW